MLFDIDKTLKTAMMILFAMMVFSSAIIGMFIAGKKVPLAQFGSPISALQKVEALEIPFHLQKTSVPISIPRLEESFSFSCERARPESGNDCSSFLVRLKKTNQYRRLKLPAKVGLKFDKELQFSDDDRAFWADIQKDGAEIIAQFLISRSGEPEEIKTYRFVAEEANLRSANEFPEGSPLRFLAESKVLGKDLFLKMYKESSANQRIEISNQTIPIKEGDFLSWQEEKWQKVPSLCETQNFPLAKVTHIDEKNIIFDAWGLDGYSRISVSSMLQIPFKTKSEEFLSSVRIRSEKQISCMLDKQCFVLRVGDWVLKEENRWKILRKNEEKNAYLQGKLEGELFVFDRIDLKSGQKNIQGNLVNVARSQMIPVNVVAQCQKKVISAREKGKTKQ